jgi:hypothetical protein
MLNRSNGRDQTSGYSLGKTLTTPSRRIISVKKSKDICEMGRFWEITKEMWRQIQIAQNNEHLK